jgi:tetratricopeptide (TPR) repeat protein
MNVLFHPNLWLSSPIMLVAGAFQLWMAVDAFRRREWLWVLVCMVIPIWGAWYYFSNYYRSGGGGLSMSGFELPGAADRRRMNEILTRIHNLDGARDHLDLADIYFRRGQFVKAEASYRESLKRDPKDIDALAHLGQCLLRLNRPTEALPLLEYVVAQEPRHEYGYTTMALAEAQTAVGNKDAAIKNWERVLATNTYARARVQYAGLLIERGEKQKARELLEETISDFPHLPRFAKRQSRPWVGRAKSLLSVARA